MARLEQIRLLAEYNRLMNTRQYEACARLTPQELAAERGAFFGSVLGTLNHILVGDIVWLRRFSNHGASRTALEEIATMLVPQKLDAILYPSLDALTPVRARLDAMLIDWCAVLREADLESALAYENFRGVSSVRLLGDLLLHQFLHQVHHRGQITTLLSQFGVDFGETDLVEIIPDVVGA